MATVTSQQIVDDIIARNGLYPGDEASPLGPVVRIVQYTDQWGGTENFGLVYANERARPDRYDSLIDAHEIWSIAQSETGEPGLQGPIEPPNPPDFTR